MRLSQRLGITPVRTALQGRELDAPTRHRLWTAFVTHIPEGDPRIGSSWMRGLYIDLWSNFFKLPVDDLPRRDAEVRPILKGIHLGGEWHEVYDLVEYVSRAGSNSNRQNYTNAVATILAEEMAGFRFLDGQLVEITDETEIQAIEDALAESGRDSFNPVRVHLQTALALLSDRRNPDYRNSVKESISAVEGVIKILAGDPQAEFRDGLRILEARMRIHPALKRALLALYGYTSDAEGIRHALSDEPALDAADAKFMLVTCAGFTVFLIQKALPPV